MTSLLLSKYVLLELIGSAFKVIQPNNIASILFLLGQGHGWVTFEVAGIFGSDLIVTPTSDIKVL